MTMGFDRSADGGSFGESWRGITRGFALFYTREEAAHAAGISLASLDRAVARGEVPTKCIGRRRLFPRKAFEEWCNRLDGGCAPCFFGLIGG
jgi:excisionase family DNA binding protein